MTRAPRTARERVLHSRVLVAWPKVEGVQEGVI